MRPALPLTDPSVNVKEIVEIERKHQNEMRLASEKRQDDLRVADVKHAEDIRKIEAECKKETSALQEKLRLAETARLDAVNVAERSRVDSRFQDIIANAALLAERNLATATTLQKTVETSAEALRSQAAGSNAILTAAIKVLEQNQYQAGGASAQSKEGRQQNQWLIGIIIIIAIFLANYLPHLFK